MSNLEKPNNDWAKALWVLNQSFMGGVSMVTVLKDYDPFFYKFQTRLLEVEKLHPKLRMSRVTLTHKSRITGKEVHYTQYTPICPKPYLVNLYNKVNREGLKMPSNQTETSVESFQTTN